MKNIRLKISLLSFLLLSFVACDVDQTQQTKLPEVDIDVDTKAGQLPSFEVNWADVDVGTRTQTVSIPKVVVVMEEVEVEVPYVDVDIPNEGEKRELTLVSEAEIAGLMHEINIQEVHATGKRIIVISELKSTGKKIDKKESVRVSDRLILNAPDLDVKHYIIGKKPRATFNNQFTYINSKVQIQDKLKNGRMIYKRK